VSSPASAAPGGRSCVRARAGLSLARSPRSGGLSADELREDFARALDGAAAPQLFADLAALLPQGSQRAEIRAAAARAGWGASPDPTTSPSNDSAQALPRASASAQAGQAYSTYAGGAGAGGAEDAAAPASAAPPQGEESSGTGWVPLERSRIAERADQLASELAGGPYGGVAVEDAGSEAARRSTGMSQAPGAAQEQRAGDAARAGADTVRSSAPGSAAAAAVTPAEREAAALEAAGLNEWGSPVRSSKRPRRGRGGGALGGAAAAAGAAAGAAGAPGTGAGARPNVLFWLRQELRLHDNPALSAAAAEAARCGGVLTCMYVHSPEEDGDALHGGARPGPEGFVHGREADRLPPALTPPAASRGWRVQLSVCPVTVSCRMADARVHGWSCICTCTLASRRIVCCSMPCGRWSAGAGFSCKRQRALDAVCEKAPCRRDRCTHGCHAQGAAAPRGC